jgi:hypothetical protein
MPITGARASSMHAYADDASYSVSYTHNFGSAYAEGKALLLHHGASGSSSTASAYVSQYVQAGTPHSGYWPLVSGPNFTSITYTLYVLNGDARAVWETFFWG